MGNYFESNLDLFFAPRSIAVVGASNSPGKMGNLFIQRLAAGFRGRLYPINPGETEVVGLKALASPSELPEPVDLLITLVPAARLLGVIKACAFGQVQYVLAIPSGFGEVSAEGRDVEAQLVTAARSRGIRIIGPNCVGMLNCGVGLNASMMPVLPPGGRGLSCLTQSGGFGMAFAMYALDHNLPISKFADLGNMADLQIDDALRYFGDDTETTVIGLFLESVRQPDSFLRVLAEVAAKKPVLLASVGRTAAGRRASYAHLGIIPDLAELQASLPLGVIRNNTGLELLNTAKAIIWQHVAAGRRIAIITGSGGIGAELADLAVEQGLDVPEFSHPLQVRLRRHIPVYAGARNPVDLTPNWWNYPTIYPAVLGDIVRSGEVDALLVSITDVAATLPKVAEAIAAFGRESRLPITVFWGARDQDGETMRMVEAACVPCYRSTVETLQALAAVCRSQKSGRSGDPLDPDDSRTANVAGPN